MYRRIEFIEFYKGNPKSPHKELRKDEWLKSGLLGGFSISNATPEQLILFDKMLDCLEGLKGVGTGKNNRYYFTELGWKKIGKNIIEYAQKLKLEYKIIKIKESSVDIMATDNKYEVAVRPRKRKK